MGASPPLSGIGVGGVYGIACLKANRVAGVKGATGPAAKCGWAIGCIPVESWCDGGACSNWSGGGAMSAEADLCVIANGESRPA
jgi:hypothetical protein